MERSRLRNPSLSQNEDARPGDPAFLAPTANGTPPERKHPIPKHTQTREVSRYRVVVEVALYDRLEPLSGLGHGIVHASRSCCLTCRSLARMRLRIVVRRTMNRPNPFFPLMCVKPRKSNVSGLPSPLRSRFCSANRPNSIRRVLSGWSSQIAFRLA